jgi:putative transcriptional regulator
MIHLGAHKREKTMMIKCHLSKLLGERRIHMRELARQTGISYYTLWMIYHEKNKGIYFDIIAKICRALSIQVGDLFEYRETEEKPKKRRK